MNKLTFMSAVLLCLLLTGASQAQRAQTTAEGHGLRRPDAAVPDGRLEV
jgi:hypothetical protein